MENTLESINNKDKHKEYYQKNKEKHKEYYQKIRINIRNIIKIIKIVY